MNDQLKWGIGTLILGGVGFVLLGFIYGLRDANILCFRRHYKRQKAFYKHILYVLPERVEPEMYRPVTGRCSRSQRRGPYPSTHSFVFEIRLNP